MAEPTPRQRYMPPASLRGMGRGGSGAACWSRRAAPGRRLHGWSRSHGLKTLAVGAHGREWLTASRRHQGGAAAPHPQPRRDGLVHVREPYATVVTSSPLMLSRAGGGSWIKQASDGYTRNNSTCPQLGHIRTSRGRCVSPSWFKLPSNIPPRPVAPPTRNCSPP